MKNDTLLTELYKYEMWLWLCSLFACFSTQFIPENAFAHYKDWYIDSMIFLKDYA